MRVFHDSRDLAYRAPYGAVAAGTPVTLAIDVDGTPGASVTLRTWTEGAGEVLHEMAPSPGEPAHYEATIEPDAPGIVWYHFMIEDANGDVTRYGAREGRTGGEGQLLGWEPPSFQLSVHGPDTADGGNNTLVGEGEGALAGAPPYNADLPRFADAVVRFLRGEIGAPILAEVIDTVRESYPIAGLPHAFELLERPDCAHLFAHLAGLDEPEDDFDADRDLDDGQRGLAKGRLWCASLIRALMPDEPAVPLDRIVAQWDTVTADCKDIAENVADLQRALGPFTNGGYACFSAGDDVFGFWRRGAGGEAACVLVNASLEHAHDVLVPMAGAAVSEVIGGYGVEVVSADGTDAHDGALQVPGDADRYAHVHLTQLGSAVAYFHPQERLGRAMELGLGVLAHITSIPADDSGQPGTLGTPARAFVDWLADAGVRYWQVLPVNPTDGFGSPYAGISAFAGNVRLLEGGPADVAHLPVPRATRAYQAFCERERDWLEPYASFMAIRQKLSGTLSTGESVPPWQEWPEKYRRYNARLVEGDAGLARLAEQWRRAQFAFERQWGELRTYANGRGVRIIGDMPIYVSADSSDAWAHPELFQLDAHGNPAAVAGCPPDAFAADGQVWGNPVYDWDALRKDGYDWWLRRLTRAFELYDVVRLDHFIGFARYYSIPAGEKATMGTYRPGPGIDLFHRAHEKLGPLPIIAEDLGLITPGVRALVASCGFPGMDIVQFVDGGDPLAGYAPRPEKIAYTGTHDNQTLVGYCEVRYPELDVREAAGKLLEAVVTCDADVRIVPLQDMLGLGDDARMNVPGTAEGNWTWQATRADVDAAAPRTRALAQLKTTLTAESPCRGEL